MSVSDCVCMCVRPATEVSRDAAVRVQDTQYVADDVSKLSLQTVTLSQWESVEIGGRREEQQD